MTAAAAAEPPSWPDVRKTHLRGGLRLSVLPDKCVLFRIGRGEVSGSPEVELRPNTDAQMIGCVQKRWIVRIVGGSNEIHACVFNHLYIAPRAAVGDGIAPAGMVLVDVRPLEPKMVFAQEEAALLVPANGPNAKR